MSPKSPSHTTHYVDESVGHVSDTSGLGYGARMAWSTPTVEDFDTPPEVTAYFGRR
jgi:hypothetical protein